MRWKWFTSISILMIVVFIAAVYVYLNTYDYNKLKPRIARMVREATGRELTLSGELDLAFGFSPALVVKDVTFANASWGSLPQMVEIERLQAQIRLLPLLFKDLEIVQIGFSGVKVLLETGADARNNWDFLAKRKSANSAGAFMPPEIGVDQVSIKNLQLTFHRHQTVSKTQFTLSSLSMSRQEDENDLTLKLHADYNGQPVTLKGTIGSIHQLLLNTNVFQFDYRESFRTQHSLSTERLTTSLILRASILRTMHQGPILQHFACMPIWRTPKSA